VKLIVGIGNPGKEYERTRHNLGFLVVERLAKKFDLKFQNSSLTKGLVAEGKVQEQEALVLLPLTYVNNSGIAVKQIVESVQIPLENILIVCDDFNIDFRRMRVRAKGGDGGHNGLHSIIYHLNSESFPRLRLGVGPLPRNANQNGITDFVLGEFSKAEQNELEEFVSLAAQCCETYLLDGVERAMEQFNSN